MDVVIPKSKNLIRSTMPELIALKLYHSAKEGHATSPNINTNRKDRYIDRHKAREDWTKSGAKAAVFYTKHVLWNKPILKASIDDINKKFKSLNIKMK